MFDAVWTASLRSLNTRREVRGFLAKGKSDLTGGPAQQDLSAELSDLATGSDSEVIDSYRYLDELCKGLSARDATYPRIVMTRNVRDLFAKALQRMKDLPPDPRQTLHAKAPKTPDVGCATGVYSSRRIEAATHDSIAFRYIAANEQLDHNSCAPSAGAF
jgi:hypothetical protein